MLLIPAARIALFRFLASRIKFDKVQMTASATGPDGRTYTRTKSWGQTVDGEYETVDADYEDVTPDRTRPGGQGSDPGKPPRLE